MTHAEGSAAPASPTEDGPASAGTDTPTAVPTPADGGTSDEDGGGSNTLIITIVILAAVVAVGGGGLWIMRR